MPLPISLIEKGNAGGSWNCAYPKETAVFILQGFAGMMAEEQMRKNSPQEKNKRLRSYMESIVRVLGADLLV